MNNILQLKRKFQENPSSGRPGHPKLPKNSTVKSEHLKKLLENLERLRKYWAENEILNGALIDVHYTKVIAKSNRISGFLSKGKTSANNSIVGARFFINGLKRKHIITYYVNDKIIGDTITKLKKCIQLIEHEFGGNITSNKLDILKSTQIKLEKHGISLTTLRHIIVDSHYIEKFDIPNNRDHTKGQSIITIYKTDADAAAVMRKIDIDVPAERIINGTTMLLQPPQITRLRERAPYLIAMATENQQSYDSGEDEVVKNKDQKTNMTIDSPGDEPIIGVIDTMFDERVYFSEWVEFQKMISVEIPIHQNDYDHGTAVSSIIVDGPAINPELDDGCGRFRVKHFGVAAQGQYSAFDIMKQVKVIVETNPNIKVWNLSLGSDSEVNLNSISPEASILDRIQYEQDVIFVVAGTNKHNTSEEKRIGSPADSINSIVVNSVNGKGKPASYSRKGLVLSFFNKPDVSSYGGDRSTKDFIKVCTPTGESLRTGTSFAAPWVTRKIAYLIEVVGLSREVAKALIVDAAAGWRGPESDQGLAPLVGHGIVPVKIDDVLKSQDDEIKFVISGTSNMYDTYTHNLPVPTYNRKYPFVAKATLCYFPKCSINQGVDYTNTELDIYLGRVHKKPSKSGRDARVGIKSINKNSQSTGDGEKRYIYEGEAREWYRKWDNTKHIRESYGSRIMPKKVYESGMWGISIKTKERLARRDGDGVKFGMVVTLREIHGINRIDDFFRQCLFHGWLVNKVDVESRVEVYNKAQETVEFDA